MDRNAAVPRRARLLGSPRDRSGAVLAARLKGSRVAHAPGHSLHACVETLLSRPETELPEGAAISDKEGHVRTAIRTRWWAPELAAFDAAYIGPAGAIIPALPLPQVLATPAPNRPTFYRALLAGARRRTGAALQRGGVRELWRRQGRPADRLPIPERGGAHGGALRGSLIAAVRRSPSLYATVVARIVRFPRSPTSSPASAMIWAGRLRSPPPLGGWRCSRSLTSRPLRKRVPIASRRQLS